MKTLSLLSMLGLGFAASAGAGTEPTFALPDDLARQHEIQTRQWRATDEAALLRAVMSAMQDLEFVLDDAEPALALALGTKYISGQRIRLVVFVRPRSTGHQTVRVCAYLFGYLVDDPEVYQDFFDALDHTASLAGGGISR